MQPVVPRRIQVAEGDPYSATKIHASEQNLKDLGFFEESKITPTDGSTPDRADLKPALLARRTSSPSRTL